MTIEQLQKYLKNHFRVISLDQIDLAPWNYKKEDEETAKQLIESIKKNGQIQVLNVRTKDDGRKEVGDGNHRVIALKELEHEGALCIDHGKITVEKLIEISLTLNELQLKTDVLKLSDLLNEYKIDYDTVIDTTPYTVDDLTEIKALKDIDDLEEWVTIEIKAPKVEVEIFNNEMERIKELAETDSDWVGLKMICVNSANTPTESLK